MDSDHDSLRMRVITCGLSMLLATVLVPCTALAAQGDVSYIKRSWDGKKIVSTSQNAEANPVPADGHMTSGWYYLDSDVKVNRRISLTGDTNLILGDGHTLDVKGIYVPAGTTLAVYAQSDGDQAGKIVSHPSSGAAIGATSGKHRGGSVEIHGGRIEATGHKHCAGIGSNDGDGTTAPITIYGGTVTATGGSDGAGIGGGRKCDGGDIAIYGGKVTAKGGGQNGAAIGGGDSADGGEITIAGGNLDSFFRDGAGIGGGEGGDGGKIDISGGVTTTHPEGQGNGAGIGGGNHSGAGGTVAISGGTVKANSRCGAGIGGGRAANGDMLMKRHNSGAGGDVTITGGDVRAHSEYGFGIGAGGQSGDRVFFIDGNVDFIGCAGHINFGGDASVEAMGRPAGMGGDGGSIAIQDSCYVDARGVSGKLDSEYSKFKTRDGNEHNSGKTDGHARGVLLMDKKASLEIDGGCLKATGSGQAHGITLYESGIDIKGGALMAQSGSEGVGCVSWKGVSAFEGAQFETGPDADNLTVLPAEQQADVQEPDYEYLRVSSPSAAAAPALRPRPVAAPAQLYSHALSADGTIGMDVSLMFDDEVLAHPEDYQVEVTRGDKLVLAQKVSEVEPTTREDDGVASDVYRFSIASAPRDIEATLTLRVRELGSDTYVALAGVDGSAVEADEGLTLSVADCMRKSAEGGSFKQKALARNMLAFCTYASHYYAVSECGCTAQPPVIDDFAPSEAHDIPRVEGTTPDDIEHFVYKGASLEVGSTMTYRLHFGSDCPEVVRIFCNGSTEALEIKQEGRDEYYVEVPDIAVRDLDQMYEFEIISSGGESTKMCAGPYSYANEVIAQEGDTCQRRTEQFEMVALLRYSESLKRYQDD